MEGTRELPEDKESGTNVRFYFFSFNILKIYHRRFSAVTFLEEGGFLGRDPFFSGAGESDWRSPAG